MKADMKSPKKQGRHTSTPDGFINVPVTKATRDGLHTLKESMGVASQAEVIEKLVAIGLAIQQAARG
ncbi:hypothetical protein E4K72_09090 [Oxalobacteraceae bacterium OM1]|nr:hypothetical protein E4K72_09090 [Oxalobacteraceae bacterium OM1]